MWARDVKFSLRSLGKNPSMTLTAIAALALGIGANTALFTVVNAVLLRPMNYPHAEQIVELTRTWQHGAYKAEAVTPTKYDFWRRENHSFEAVGAINFTPVGVNITGARDPQRLTSLPVTAGFFRVLGVQPWIGRTFTESEDTPGAGHFAVLSYGVWRHIFHSDRTIVGRSIALNNASYTVLGVMPRDFQFPKAADLWTPLQLTIDPADHANDYSVIARLRPETSVQQAAADMHVVGERFRRQFGSGIMMSDNEGIGVFDFQSWVVGNVRPALLVLMAAVGFVLLIACANVANLLLARSAVRQHEMALRTALGASGWQLMRMLLTESLLLSLAGAGCGLLLAQSAVPLLIRLAPANLPLLDHIELNRTVILFTGVVAVLTGLLFGIFPALQNFRLGAANPLREAGSRTTASASVSRTRQALVIAEIAFSLILLTGAGLLIQTVMNLSGVNPGFDTRHVLTMQMSLTEERFRTTGATALLMERITNRLESIPGVEAVGTITNLPTQPGFDDPFEIIGRAASKDVLDEFFRVVSPHYFSAMHIPVVAGRAFTERDTQASQRVIIVNQAFARKYFPKQSPLGQQILVGRIMGPVFADLPREIVGVVGDTRDGGLNMDPQPIFFEPVAQLPDALIAMGNQLIPVNWLIRTSGDPLGMIERIRRETLVASGGIPMAEPRPLDDVVGSSIAQQRFSMILLGIFAALAMLLGAIGIYGVISYSVAQRTRELGIRAALGAARGDLLGLVLKQGVWLTGAGLVLGFIAALGLTQFLKDMLYGVTPFDTSVLTLAAATLGIVAISACWFPARRATKVDPVIALRQE